MTLAVNKESAYKFDPIKYGKILQIARPRTIDNNADYRRVSEQISKLIDSGNKKTTEESVLLKLLVTLAEEYERKHYKNPGGKASPLEVLRYLMEEHKHTAKDLWTVIGDKSLVSRILHNERSISKQVATRLAEFYHVSPAVFIFNLPDYSG
jgi:HTH-type transcriptional regulator/antitoxin HigA